MPTHYSIGLSHNRALADLLRLPRLRQFITHGTAGWRWRVLCEESQLASGVERTHTQARNAATAATARIREERK